MLPMLKRINSNFNRVKQTSDAAVDSNLLVRLSDLARKQATKTHLGSAGAVNIDVDDFVSRCISFMKSSNSPRGRNRQVDDDTSDLIDGLPWASFSRNATFPSSRRPALPHHLLGPLSVQRKIRVQKAPRSTAGMRKANPAKAVKPTEMSLDEGESNHQTSALNRVTGVFTVLWKYWLTKTPEERDEGLNYFEVVVNPESFSQTIENIFYVAFLVKNGNVELFEEDAELDSSDESESEAEENGRKKKKKGGEGGGLLRIFMFSPEEVKQSKPELEDHKGKGRTQMLMSLNQYEWKQIVEAFELRGKEPVIPNRVVEEQAVGANAWFK